MRGRAESKRTREEGREIERRSLIIHVVSDLGHLSTKTFDLGFETDLHGSLLLGCFVGEGESSSREGSEEKATRRASFVSRVREIFERRRRRGAHSFASLSESHASI